MLTSNAERLIILGQICEGLMSRLYNLTNFKLSGEIEPFVQRVAGKLIRRFPEYPEPFEAVCSPFIFLSSCLLFLDRTARRPVLTQTVRAVKVTVRLLTVWQPTGTSDIPNLFDGMHICRDRLLMSSRRSPQSSCML